MSEDEEEPSAEESSIEPISTKKPTNKATANEKLTPRKRIEAKENELLQVAIECLKEEGTKKGSEDADELFGKFVASELRTISDEHIKRQAKWKIQFALFEVHDFLHHNQPPPWPNAYGACDPPLPRHIAPSPTPSQFNVDGDYPHSVEN